MRWATYRTEADDRVGVVSGDVVHALAPGIRLIDLVALGDEGLRDAGERALHDPAEAIPLREVQLRPPIPRPASIRDCLCFLDHMRNCQEAMGGGRVLKDVWYRIPAFYFANPSGVFGPSDEVPMAPGSAWQDFELEIAAVIGGPGGADLSVAEAHDAIIGYTIFNDWSARDLQMLEGQLGIGQAKGKDSGVTLGPYLVTADELQPHLKDGRLSLDVTALVNGEVVGSGSTGAMDWSFAEVIAYASRGVTLHPGDVFGSGTVPTCTLVEHLKIAELAQFRRWLRDGDEVTLASRRSWARSETSSATVPRPSRFPRDHIQIDGGPHLGSTPRLHAGRSRVGCTTWATACGHGCCRTVDMVGATRVWSPETVRPCSSTRSSTWR